MSWAAWISVMALVAGYTLIVLLISPKKSYTDRLICLVVLAANAWLLTALTVWLRP